MPILHSSSDKRIMTMAYKPESMLSQATSDFERGGSMQLSD